MVGRERRNPERLRQEGHRRLAPNLLVAAVIAGSVAALLLIKGLQMLAAQSNSAWWHAYTGTL